MIIRHHPDEMLLAGCAAGTLDPGIALIVASHASFCPACRETIATFEAVGGVMLEDIEPVPLAASALEDCLAKLDEPAVSERRPPAANEDTPEPLRRVIGGSLKDVRWRKLGADLDHATLYREGECVVRLLRGRPGAHVGHHGHAGSEYTLALRGGYADITGSYGPGDFQAASEDLRHDPTVDPDDACIILAVTTAPLVFDGWVRRLVGRLYGF